MTAAHHAIQDEGLPARCRDCTSRQLGFCADLTAAELTRLHPHVVRRRVDAGTEILSQGSANTSYVNVLNGAVKLRTVLQDGAEQIVGLRFAGDFLGQRFARDVGYTAQAATDVEFCRVAKPAIDLLADNAIHVAHLLHKMVASELQETRNLMLTLSHRDAGQKVAGLLYGIGQRQSPAALRTVIELPLSRAEIGNYLGLTVETVSRQIGRLKREGLISLEGKTRMTIEDMGKLASAAGITA